jgi:hypothetical protein
LIVTAETYRTPSEDALSRAFIDHTVTGIPAKVDWRNNNGNFITPIQDQSGCGSCVAFGTTAALEACQRIYDKNPGKDVKLSEADLFSKGGRCNYGWTLEAANSAAQKYGVCAERCYSYSDFMNGYGPQACCSTKIIRPTCATRITSDAVAKQFIATYGPIQAAMEVNSDFFDYSGGVYRPQYGDFVGNHCICLIGYDDVKGCWIGKNSWGTYWGEDGFFEIAYGVCEILRGFVAYGELVGSSPGPGPAPIKPDLIVPKDGVFQISKIFDRKTSMDYTLIVNDKEVAVIGSMPIDYTMKMPYVIGSFKKGDGLTFQLKKGDALYHFVQTYPSGWRSWNIRMGLKQSVFKDVYFVLKEI